MSTATQTGSRGLYRAVRLAAAVLPLPGLLVPVAAHAGTPVTIAICSGQGERTIALPAHEDRVPRRDEQGCAHFVCPRERAQGDAAEDDED